MASTPPTGRSWALVLDLQHEPQHPRRGHAELMSLGNKEIPIHHPGEAPQRRERVVLREAP
ncbi:hypothetical protein PG994_006544 [Apiospora phragmitis]|uniref:Uncharacterized protein n=1 Tax=Apiospora phragmitis TaxID=2905665 RepID=A0ABR1VFC2_9PEZI